MRTNLRVLILISGVALGGFNALAAKPALNAQAFVQVEGDHFKLNGDRYAYLGANLWSAMNLGSDGPGGDRARLVRELDRLQALGIKNLRIVAASEGPDTEAGRIVPSLQASPGNFDLHLLQGLDFALEEMRKRDMKAVMVLNNFWAWSGGMAQYVAWVNGGKIPYPPPFGLHTWDTFIHYSSQFYSNPKAIALANASIAKIVQRTNTLSQVPYVDDPTIMAWELGNEPRGANNTGDYNKWIVNTARLIKSFDAHHLVTTGTEGSLDGAGVDITVNDKPAEIDYATTHIWVQNFGWYDPTRPSTYASAVTKMKDYLHLQIQATASLKKPLVLEEFGFSRDGNSYVPTSPVTLRDQFYDVILGEAFNDAKAEQSVCGVNFWAWSGEAVPPPGRTDSTWRVGDPFLGDPPHEAQGWYSIYATDTSTLSIIQKYTSAFDSLK